MERIIETQSIQEYGPTSLSVNMIHQREEVVHIKGCIKVRERHLRYLLAHLPLGGQMHVTNSSLICYVPSIMSSLQADVPMHRKDFRCYYAMMCFQSQSKNSSVILNMWIHIWI
jgi:hypothetical protein